MRPHTQKGISILEILLVVAILSLIVVAISPLFGSIVRSWQIGERQTELYNRARVGMDRMVKAIRQAQSVSSITSASDTDGQLVLTDTDDETFGFRRNSSDNELEYDLPGTPTSWSTLVDSVGSLSFTAYEANGTTTTTTVSDIKSIVISMTLTDEENTADSVSLTTRASLRREVASYSLVINEINYNPTYGGASEPRNEYVELYNYGSDSIDMTGWTISDSASTDDILAAGGTIVIPAGGYAVLTADPTDVYTNYSVDAGAIRLDVDDSRIGNGLSDSGETLTLYDSSGTEVEACTYDDAWGGDGDGDTVERISATGGSSDSGNWEASSDTGSDTPGTTNST